MAPFAAKPAPTADKLRGGYYTPPAIARYLAGWVREAGPRLLEPACGDGAILDELVRGEHGGAQALGVELFADEAGRAAARAGVPVRAADFFDWFTPDRHGAWDGVAGNPPYIRFGHWPEAARGRAFALMRGAGMAPTRLTNAWVPFVVGAVLALRPGGRLGLVLPAELLQVGYAAPLRRFLVDHLGSATVVAFRELVFPGILQEVVLLLGARGAGPAHLRTLELDDVAALASAPPVETLPGVTGAGPDAEKWTTHFLAPPQVELMRGLAAAPGVARLRRYGEVDVGVVTGRNSFFTMTPGQAAQRGLGPRCVPLVARSAQLVGVRFGPDDLAKLEAEDARCRLLALDAAPPPDPASPVARYLAEGAAQGVHLGYKCSVRRRWWAVPSVWVPDAFLLRQLHAHPRVVANAAGAVSTDTVHRLRVTGVAGGEQVAAGTVNSLTFASAELVGRSYGGGILELEPTEAEELLVPPLHRITPTQVADVDEALRRGDVAAALDLVDEALLVGHLGWDRGRVRAVRGVWERLRDRRVRRGRNGTRISPPAATGGG